MKFQNKDEISLFLIDCGREDMIPTISENFEPDADMVELFIKRRKKTISHLKDFRRKQLAKEQWRHNRYAMMKGIKTFHDSTKGKRFHRSLGRFLSTRVPLTAKSHLSIRNASESYLHELTEVFKALSSYKTHAWIQLETYLTPNDTADYELFLEEAIRVVSTIESELLKPEPDLPHDAVDFLLATLNHDYIFDAIEDKSTNNFAMLQEQFHKLLELNAKEPYPYLHTLSQLIP